MWLGSGTKDALLSKEEVEMPENDPILDYFRWKEAQPK
jgi:hypothetical protein